MRQLKIEENIKNRKSVAMEEAFSVRPLVTEEEEQVLVRKIQDGDTESLIILTKAYQEWIETIAKQYQNQGIAFPNLVEAGNNGLTKGIEQFDEKRGFSFRSYVTWCIRQSIVDAVKEKKQ